MPKQRQDLVLYYSYLTNHSMALLFGTTTPQTASVNWRWFNVDQPDSSSETTKLPAVPLQWWPNSIGRPSRSEGHCEGGHDVQYRKQPCWHPYNSSDPAAVTIRGHSQKFLVPYARTSIFRQYFFADRIRIWNSLSQSAISSESLEAFKRSLLPANLS